MRGVTKLWTDTVTTPISPPKNAQTGTAPTASGRRGISVNRPDKSHTTIATESTTE